MQDRMRQIKETKAATTGNAAATRTRIAAASKPAPKPFQPGKTGLRRALRSRKEIRRAIVMKEILGPPLGLR